jgi:hypothetical protein
MGGTQKRTLTKPIIFSAIPRSGRVLVVLSAGTSGTRTAMRCGRKFFARDERGCRGNGPTSKPCFFTGGTACHTEESEAGNCRSHCQPSKVVLVACKRAGGSIMNAPFVRGASKRMRLIKSRVSRRAWRKPRRGAAVASDRDMRTACTCSSRSPPEGTGRAGH